MKLTNFFSIFLAVFFVMGVLFSTHAGQKGVVVSPYTEGIKVETDASKAPSVKVKPGKIEPKALPQETKVAPKKKKVGIIEPQKPTPRVKCNGKVVTKLGTSGVDYLNGTPGDDVIHGLGGNDFIRGMGGDDTICGGDGNDKLYGGDGKDFLDGGNGNDILDGGPGSRDECINGPSGRGFTVAPKNCEKQEVAVTEGTKKGSVKLKKGGGFVLESKTEKTISGGQTKMVPRDGSSGESGFVSKLDKVQASLPKCNGQTPTIFGTSGDDTIYGTQEADVIHGLGGNDKINGLGGDDIICGGDGDDQIEGASGNDELLGGDGNDTLWGSDGDDIIRGMGGNDILYGHGGNDAIYAGPGNDFLYGGDGDDTLLGQEGSDVLEGNDGNDWMAAGPGEDFLYGGDGNDNLWGESGPNILEGGPGNDKLFGGINGDLLKGDTGDDYLKDYGGGSLQKGGEGNDRLEGSSGKDTLHGGPGDDELYGRGGNDSLYGCDCYQECSGNDKLYGGDGPDLLIGGGGGLNEHYSISIISNNELYGENGDDILYGSQSNRLDGGPGYDSCIKLGTDTGYVIAPINCEGHRPKVVRPKFEASLGKSLKPKIYPKIIGMFASENPIGEGGMGRVSPLGKLYIKGSNFGTQKGTIHLSGNFGKVQLFGKDVTWESETQVNGKVPWITGVKDHVMEVQVETKDGLLSNKATHFFSATRETRYLNYGDPAVDVIRCDGYSSHCDWISSAYEAFTFGGHHQPSESSIISVLMYEKGTDQFKITLKNNWVVTGGYYTYMYASSSNEELHGPIPTQIGEATWSPEFKWVVSPGDYIQYRYRVMIRGPKGVPHN